MICSVKHIEKQITVLFSNTNRVGGNNKNNRYKPNMEAEKIWRNLANEEYLKIKDYFNKN